VNTRLRLLVIGLGALIVVAVFTFPLWRPLFVNDVVDEAFPGLSAEERAAFDQMPAEERAMYEEMLKTEPTMAVEMVKAAISPDVVVPTEEQAMPEMVAPVIVATGSFIQIDVVHGASGTATIYELPDQTRVLRFENFQSTNGPDLHVLLSRDPDPRSHDALGEDYIELGRLKGNVGNQNYDVPSSVDLSQYQSVVIYCQPFQVVFSTATLVAS
jgi:hypothetical protein